jgi:uncharacterized Rossmann fold enzyme
VRFVEWFPYYQNIRQQFGYSTEKDQEAAYYLSQIIRRKALALTLLHKKIAGKNVLVIGAGPSLEKNIIFIKSSHKFIKIVSDGAVQALIENNIKPDIVVTDLDGNQSFLQKAEKKGTLMVVHAHGDNIDKLGKIVPRFRHVIGSTQVMPIENVHNFGGFTDGDRSVFLAEECGAEAIVLVGMDFGVHIGKYSKQVIKNIELKRKKLKTAKLLLEMLAKKSRSRLFDTSKRPIRGFAAYYSYNNY